MFISIEYSSIWGNSFLGEPDKNGYREYIATGAKMNDFANKNNALDYYKPRKISMSTVQGILFRLLGARASLSTLLAENTLLNTLINEDKIGFVNHVESESDELVYLRNKNLSVDREGYSGTPNDDIFNIDGIQTALCLVKYSREELLDYYLHDKRPNRKIENQNILTVVEQLSVFEKEKSFKLNEDEFESASKITMGLFNNSCSEKASIGLLAFNKAIKLFFDEFEIKVEELTGKGTFKGISLNGNSFTKKDFMKPFATPRISFGGPYKTDIWVDNPVNGKQMKLNKKLTKSDGRIEIEIDCDFEQATKLKELISNAGVGSFYVGKKGLGYVDSIII